MRSPIIFTLVVALLSDSTFAVTDQERAALQRLNIELITISKIIDDAHHAVNPHDRRQIDYLQLKNDLKRIQEGILDSINAERRDPRSLPPIHGVYG